MNTYHNKSVTKCLKQLQYKQNLVSFGAFAAMDWQSTASRR